MVKSSSKPMVELPESAQILRTLKGKVEGRRITAVRLFRPKSLKHISADAFKSRLSGASFSRVSRRGKIALLYLDTKDVLIVAFGMTGKLLLETALAPHPHLIFSLALNNDSFINFYDARKFGRLSLSSESGLQAHPLICNLGLEYDDPNLTADYLLSKARNLRQKSIKEFLLDQRFICGVGNIYASEILFDAKIDPRRQASKLSRSDFGRILVSTRKVLSSAIIMGGTTFRDFQDAEGKPGKFQGKLKVFQRAGKPCPRCHSPHKILRIVQGQRSTFFCPNCQR